MRSNLYEIAEDLKQNNFHESLSDVFQIWRKMSRDCFNAEWADSRKIKSVYGLSVSACFLAYRDGLMKTPEDVQELSQMMN